MRLEGNASRLIPELEEGSRIGIRPKLLDTAPMDSADGIGRERRTGQQIGIDGAGDDPGAVVGFGGLFAALGNGKKSHQKTKDQPTTAARSFNFHNKTWIFT